jgi:hypothetical protein
LARSSPDFSRSRIMARSNSANIPIIWNMIVPVGIATAAHPQRWFA